MTMITRLKQRTKRALQHGKQTLAAAWQPVDYGVHYAYGKTRLQFSESPRIATAPKIPKSRLYNRDELGDLSAWIDDMRHFHPELRSMVNMLQQIRGWEYGALMDGIPDLRGKRILDIGTGPSWLPIYLAERHGAQVVVLDLPEPYTVEARDLAHRLAQSHILLELGDMRAMGFANESFDCVLSISVIEHLSHSKDKQQFLPTEEFLAYTKQTLTEMYRVLVRGGWLYLTTEIYLPNLVNGDAWGRRLIDGKPFGAYPMHDLQDIFLDTLATLGATFPYPVELDERLLREDERYATYRNRYISAFNLFVQKPL